MRNRCLLTQMDINRREAEKKRSKVPLLWVMKGSYFGFGSPQQQSHIQARTTFYYGSRFERHVSWKRCAMGFEIRFLLFGGCVKNVSPIRSNMCINHAVLKRQFTQRVLKIYANGLGFVLKTTRFNDSESTLSFVVPVPILDFWGPYAKHGQKRICPCFTPS